ncbi:MAG TPA: S-layer homology domain-containing protein [Negativicutes bacterium]|nr:S-layer homology domain-containing protein [Negativicutes bacterium]
MKKNKFFKATVITLALLLTVTGVAYADNDISKFTDINGHWAEQHINSVYSKGLMGGVTETLFKPGDLVKNYDALVSISRMIDAENDINMEQLEAKYQEKVILKFNVPEYARKGILLCLGKGIITDYDVSAFTAKPNATKKDIVKYLGMAFGVKVDSSAPPVVLAFRDSMYIPTIYKPYVQFLIDNGIVNASGDANGNFNPDSNIDRASFAKMLDIASTVYENKKLGIDTAANNNNSTETNQNNSGTGTKTDPDTNTDNTEDTNTGDSDIPASNSGGLQVDVTAYVDEVIPEYGNLAVFVGKDRKIYKVADNATCTIDDVAGGFWKLKKSDIVKLYLENDKIIKIVGESKVRKIVGTLVSINSTDKTVLTMKTSTGDTKSFTLTAKTVVIKDGKTALWQELKEGNTLAITTSYEDLVEINADGVKGTDKGVIESITFSRIAPAKLVITALDGSQNIYYVSKNVEVSGAEGDAYSLRPGMQVEADLLDDEISKIKVVNQTASTLVKLEGMIRSIDLDAKLLVLEVLDSASNKYVDKTIYTTDETKIADIDFNLIGLGNLKANQIISIRGTGTGEGIFAKTIQVIN